MKSSIILQPTKAIVCAKNCNCYLFFLIINTLHCSPDLSQQVLRLVLPIFCLFNNLFSLLYCPPWMLNGFIHTFYWYFKIRERKWKNSTKNWRNLRWKGTHKHTETYTKYFDSHIRLSQSEESECMWTHDKEGTRKEGMKGNLKGNYMRLIPGLCLENRMNW